MILCPYEKIISKSEADFDTQWGGKRRAIWKAQSLRSFPFQIAFDSTEGLRRHDFIIVGGMNHDRIPMRAAMQPVYMERKHRLSRLFAAGAALLGDLPHQDLL